MHHLQNRSELGEESRQRDRIVVEELVVYELKASSAVMHVSVKGTSYFADDAAFKKAKEVAALIDALKELGIPENEIRLRNVIAESQSGIISKSSSAKYQLSIKCRDLEKLSEVLSTITNAKNCELHRLDWQFTEDRKRKLEELNKVFSAAKETGECIANSLGVSIQGLQHCSFEEFIVQDQHYAGSNTQMVKMMNVAPMTDSLEMARTRGGAPPLPSGQWQKQGIKARVIFHVEQQQPDK